MLKFIFKCGFDFRLVLQDLIDFDVQFSIHCIYVSCLPGCGGWLEHAIDNLTIGVHLYRNPDFPGLALLYIFSHCGT